MHYLIQVIYISRLQCASRCCHLHVQSTFLNKVNETGDQYLRLAGAVVYGCLNAHYSVLIEYKL